MGTEIEADDLSLKILNLPHYVLRILLSYLDATSLYILSQTCTYLKEFIEDSYFWKYVDARNDPNTNEKVQYCTERIHEKTTHLFLRGIKRYGHIPSNFFDKVSPFANLRVLALENQKLYGSKVSLKDFPVGLEELSLRKSYVKNSVYFFQHSAKKMQKLRVLILDECSWVTCSFLLSVSKYENLEIISAVKCLRAHLNMVPYLNVAKYGCKKLKVLDCRFTGIGGELLRTFYSKQSIQNLYFQSFKSAEVDYGEKVSSSFRSYLRSSDLETNSDLSITDSSLSDYNSTAALNVVDRINESVLYQDPYPNCICGYKETDQDKLISDIHQLDDDYVYIPPAHQTTKFVCPKHMKDVEQLPNDFKDFFVLHQRQFHSDVTSDAETETDSSGSEDDRTCCIYAMGTKMVILPNMHNLNNRSEMDLPGEGVRNDIPFNIFIVNTLGERNNPAPSTERSTSSNDQPSTSASSTSNSQTKNKEKIANERKFHDSDESESDTLDSEVPKRKFHPQKKGKRKYAAKDDSGSDRDVKKKKVEAEGDTNDDNVNKLMNSSEDVCNRLNIAIENGIEAISKRYIGVQSNDQIRPSCSTDRETTNKNKSDKYATSNVPRILTKADNNPGSSNNNPDLPLNDGQGEPVNNHSDSEGEPPRVRTLADRVLENLNHYGDRSFVRYRLPVNAHWPIKRKISLRRLSLRGYKRITDVMLSYIRNLDIDLIDLTYTSVTKQGIEDFLVHNPNCRIIHPLYCVCKPKNPF